MFPVLAEKRKKKIHLKTTILDQKNPLKVAVLWDVI
jgi:hypothetical protein